MSGPGKRLIDLEPGACSFPVNNPPRGGVFLFCGAPVENQSGSRVRVSSYCQRHIEFVRSNSGSGGKFIPRPVARAR